MTVGLPHAGFKKLLFRWRGSVWKSLWKELLIFLCLYGSINATYRIVMNPDQKKTFETVVFFVQKWLTHFPIQFLLGFFVNYIIRSWWDQLLSVPFPDQFLYTVLFSIPGTKKETRILRRTIARWLNLHAVLVWKEICLKVKKRFPTDRHLVDNGLMTEDEYIIYKDTTSTYGKWFVPVAWIGNLLAKLYENDVISDHSLQTLISQLYTFRSYNGKLTLYDWINAPLRYIQITTFATYGYFLICLIGRQGVRKKHDGSDIDIYFPIITMLEFIFYVGWLKVAEENRVPFGEEDDDYDMNYILDRNIHVSYMIVDELSGQNPEPTKDKFYRNKYPLLRHTKASYYVRDRIPNWRLQKYDIPDAMTQMLPTFDHYAEKMPPMPAPPTESPLPSLRPSLSYGMLNRLNI